MPRKANLVDYPEGYSVSIYQPTRSVLAEVSARAAAPGSPLGDRRRQASFDWLCSQLGAQRTCSINRLCTSETMRKRAQRLLNNEHIAVGSFLNACCVAPSDQYRGQTVLNVCDQTCIQYPSALGRLAGTIDELGVLANGMQYGQNAVVGLALDAAGRVPYGLSSISFHSRSAQQVPRRERDKEAGVKRDERPLRYREGHKWVEAVEQASERFATARQIIHIIDREADSLNLFCQIYHRHSPTQSRAGQTQLLVRAKYDRWMKPLTQGEGPGGTAIRLRALVGQGQPAGQLLIDIPKDRRFSTSFDRQDGQNVRQVAWREKRITRRAIVQIKFARATMDQDKTLATKSDVTAAIKQELTEQTTWFDQPLSIIRAQVVQSYHPGTNTPFCVAKDDRIDWILLTTLPVHDAEAARHVVQLYGHRFGAIEQLFRLVKKQGFNIEAAQQKTLPALQKITAMALKESALALQLVQARDQPSGYPIQAAFTPREMEVLQMCNQQLEAVSRKHQNPFDAQQLSWAAWIIARLGGWKPENQKRPAGPISMQRGLRRFYDMYAGVALAKQWQNDVSQP